MVPSQFTAEEIQTTRWFILKSIKSNSRFVNGKTLGNPYVFYKDISNLLGYEIECESDGDRLGHVVAEAARHEFATHKLLISAVVVSKEYRRPGGGFYIFAQEMGLFTIPNDKPDPDGKDELDFWKEHINQIVKFYGKQI